MISPAQQDHDRASVNELCYAPSSSRSPPQVAMSQHHGQRHRLWKLRRVAVASSRLALSALVQATVPSDVALGPEHELAFTTFSPEVVPVYRQRKPPFSPLSRVIRQATRDGRGAKYRSNVSASPRQKRIDMTDKHEVTLRAAGHSRNMSQPTSLLRPVLFCFPRNCVRRTHLRVTSPSAPLPSVLFPGARGGRKPALSRVASQHGEASHLVAI